MGKSFLWSSYERAESVSIAPLWHGAIGVTTKGNDFLPTDSAAIALAMGSGIKPTEKASVFIPSMESEKVDEYNFSGKTLKKVVEDGVLKPVLQGRWQQRKDGGWFAVPFLAFYEPEAEKKPTKKSAAKKTTGRFAKK